jgi:hypothetical protein
MNIRLIWQKGVALGALLMFVQEALAALCNGYTWPAVGKNNAVCNNAKRGLTNTMVLKNDGSAYLDYIFTTENTASTYFAPYDYVWDANGENVVGDCDGSVRYGCTNGYNPE